MCFDFPHILIGDSPPCQLEESILPGSFRFLWQRNSQRSGFGLQNGLFKPVLESQTFFLQKLVFWEQKMLRIKRQSHEGTGHKEYPQMVMQKPILSEEERRICRGEERGHQGHQDLCWTGRKEQSEQERFPKISTPALSITNTKSDIQTSWASPDPPAGAFSVWQAFTTWIYIGELRELAWLLFEQGLPKCL